MDWLLCWDLFWKFLLISLVAFGGSQSVLGLIEQTAVRESGWIGESEFAAAVGSSYLTPGPILMMSAFIGYRVQGLMGALAATLGAFLMPCLIAALASWMLGALIQRPWLRAFSGGAGAAVVGLQAVIVVVLGRHALTGWGYALIAIASAVLSLGTKIHPSIILIGGTLLGLIL